MVAGLLLLAMAPALAVAHNLPIGPEVGYAHPGASNVTVDVNLTDAPSFDPSSILISSNSSVSIRLQNVGNITHTFTLQNANQSAVALNASWSPAELNAYFAQNGYQANVSLAPGASGWVNLSYPASAVSLSYAFVSVVPYQFQAGMKGFLNVSALGPAQDLEVNTTNSFSFVPAILSATPPVPGGPTNLHILVTNLGNLPHTFTLSSQPNQTLATIAGLVYIVNVPVNASPGATATGTFTVPAPGVYEFVCTIPGHFEAGMFGFLYVGVPVPAPPTPPSTAIVQVGVLVGAGVLLGIGALLAVTASLAGRFPGRPPSVGGGPS